MSESYSRRGPWTVTGTRRERIVAELTERRFLSVQEIAERFACSIATARRDVQALEIAPEPGPRIVLVGGVLDYANGHELLGPLAEQALAQLNMDILFVSVNGIRAGTGVTIIGELNAQVMRVMATRARRVVVVAD